MQAGSDGPRDGVAAHWLVPPTFFNRGQLRMLSFYPGNKRRRYTPHQELAQACPDRFHPMDPMDPMDPRACIRLLPQQRDLASSFPAPNGSLLFTVIAEPSCSGHR